MRALQVAFSGFFSDCSGFGESARRLLRALQAAGADVVPGVPLESGANELPHPPTWLREFLERPAPAPGDLADVHLVYAAANEFPLITAPALRKVGMTAWETDRLYVSYVSGCSGLDQVIVPSRFNAEIFRAAGIEAVVVPFPVAEPVSMGDGGLGIPEISETTMVFYCVTPETKVLTSDLKWVPAGDLLLGDKLLGFDENRPPGKKRPTRRRRVRPAVVTHTGRIRRPVYLLTLSDGTTLRSSAEHPWLVRRSQRENHVWMTTQAISSSIAAGRPVSMLRFLNTWEEERTYEAGYLAAIFDGEGHLCFNNANPNYGSLGSTFTCGMAQKKGIVLSTVEDMLRLSGVAFKTYQNPRSSVQNLYLRGGWRSQAAFLGRCRPKRLLEKFEAGVISGQLRPVMFADEVVRVLCCELLGEQEVVSLETSTHTYFAEGFAAHNSILTWQERKNPRELLTAYLTAFTGYDDVVLVLKVNGPKFLKGRIEQELDDLIETINRPNPPRVHVIVDAWPESKMWALHRRGDCFVLLTRGEAFTLPALDALTVGNRIIITDWGGHIEFLVGDDGLLRDGVKLVKSRLTPVVQRFHCFTGDQRWADPDILQAADLMRAAFKDGRWPKRRHYLPQLAPEAVGTVLMEALSDGH